MSNFLIQKLPTTDRNGLKIRTDYRVWMALETLLQSPLSLIGDGIENYIKLIYKDEPTDYESALIEMAAFNNKYKENVEVNTRKNPTLDWEQDGEMVYTAFMESFHIDLIDIEYLHWWKFCALMKGISPNCELAQAIYYRGLDLSTVKDKDERNRVIKMKKQYELR